MEREDFDKVRESVRSQCGSRVVIQLDRGRNKVDIQQGVIQEAYPSVFTILVDDTETSPSQLLSFSYKIYFKFLMLLEVVLILLTVVMLLGIW